MSETAWGYLEADPANGAPPSDNPSGLYCPECRSSGVSHCAHPEWCGGMRRMTPTAPSKESPAPKDPLP